MTMESMKEVEFISQRLQANQIVTYQGLSLELKVPFVNSKAILYNFFNKNRSNLNGKLVIAGTKKNQSVIKLVEESSADKEVKSFDKIDEVFMYCISNKEFNYGPEDIVVESLKYSIDKTDLERLYKLGMIKGPKLTAAANYRTVATKVEPSSVKKEPIVTKDLKSSKPKKATTSLLSNYVSRKEAKRPIEPAPKETTSEKYQYKSRKLADKKDKVVVSTEDPFDDDDDLMEIDEPKETKAPTKTNLNDIFNDNDDSEPEAVAEDDDEKMEDIVSTANEEPIVEVEQPVEESEPEDPVEQQQPAEESIPQEPQYDEDGYLITYSKPKKPIKPAKKKAVNQDKPTSTEPVKSATRAPKPTTSANKAKNKQPSVMAFFGKKTK